MTKMLKKQTSNLLAGTMMLAGGSLALGGIGGAVAHSGQAGLSNAASFAPAMGTMMGVGAVIRAVPSGKKRRKKGKK